MTILKTICCELGEGPIWNPIREKFHFVDITQKIIYSVDEHFLSITSIKMNKEVGCVVVAETGNLVACCENEVILVDLDTLEKNYY